MSNGKYNLVCVAHPDDETIFFGGLLQRRRARPWTVACATDANADGQGALRKKQFARACKALGVESPLWLGFPDRYEDRLDISALVKKLRALPTPYEIFTHGPLGEYEHPHHQDVSYAVHLAFADHPRVYASSYNAFPELRVHLTPEEFKKKTHVLTNIYGSETSRFLNLLPATSSEGFLKLPAREVEALYNFLSKKGPLKKKDLKVYSWMADYLMNRPDRPRPF